MLMITRDAHEYRARFICRCSFIPCVGASNAAHEAALRSAFAGQGMDRVSALHFGEGDRTHAWLAGDDWWLSTSAPKAAVIAKQPSAE
jgi:hypothetical protein